jgi:hypothetical protein
MLSPISQQQQNQQQKQKKKKKDILTIFKKIFLFPRFAYRL